MVQAETKILISIGARQEGMLAYLSVGTWSYESTEADDIALNSIFVQCVINLSHLSSAVDFHNPQWSFTPLVGPPRKRSIRRKHLAMKVVQKASLSRTLLFRLAHASTLSRKYTNQSSWK